MKGPILVIGSTGNQGGHVARALLDAGWTVHAFTRNPASAGAQILKDKGAILVQGDLSDLSSLKTAIRNVTGIFSVQNFWDLGLNAEVRLGSNVIQAAKESGNNPHIVYSSGLGAERRQSVAAIDGKALLEERLRASGLPYTILRPGLFMDDFLGASLPFAKPLQKPLASHRPLVGRLFLATLRAAVPGDRPIPLTTLRDVGRLACWVWENPMLSQNKTVILVGDALDPWQMCEAWAARTQETVPSIPGLSVLLRFVHPTMASLLRWLGSHPVSATSTPISLMSFETWLSKQSSLEDAEQ